MHSSPALDVALRPTDTDLPADEQLAILLLDLDAVAVEQIGARASRVHFATTVARDRAAGILGHAASVADIRSVDVADEGWAIRSQALLRAVAVDRVVVAPPWDVPASSEGLVVIIEPSMGFGTGHHPSTRLCLRALQEIVRLTPEATVLDVGTGSGVLAIASSLLGAHDVTGLDSDPDAIDSARRNLLLNPGATVRFACADVEVFTDGPRDLVIANLTMDLLCRHAGALRRLLTEGGLLVTSGFTEDQEHEVAAAFGALSAPLVPVQGLVEGDWIATLFQRSPQTN